MSITLARPSRYTDGTECYIAENASYPGIIGQGENADEAVSCFEAARRAYEQMTQVQRDTPATVTWFKPSTQISRTLSPVPVPA